MMIEAIAAITLLTVGLLGIFSLTSRSLSLNQTVASQYIGAHLAAEGIELVKNLIDKNIMEGRSWNSNLAPGDYEIDYNDASLNISAGRPILLDSGTGFYSYDSGNPTNYQRLVKISHPSSDEIKVVSSVAWASRGGNFRADLEDHFFNWR